MKRILVYCSLFSLAVAACEEDHAPALSDCPFTLTPPAPTSTSWSISSSTAIPQPAEHPCDYVKAEKNGTQWMAHATDIRRAKNVAFHRR